MTSPAHIFPFSIAYADTDAGGIAYHARYVEIAERARMNWMRGAIPPDGDIGFVVREINVKYKKPLRLGDGFVVETRMLRIGNASLDVEQKFVKDGEICAILIGKAAYIGADLKPKKIPEVFSLQSAECN
jgi:acyl-CoA thioester hydrolase